jgi:quinol monooxygenase YgiN
MNPIEKNPEIISAVRTTVLPEHRKELCLTISSLLDLIRSEDGCRTYRFYGEDGDQNSFILIGEWETREAWNHHLSSDNFAVLVASLRILGDRSNVDFDLLSHVAAVEKVTKARFHSWADATRRGSN